MYTNRDRDGSADGPRDRHTQPHTRCCRLINVAAGAAATGLAYSAGGPRGGWSLPVLLGPALRANAVGKTLLPSLVARDSTSTRAEKEAALRGGVRGAEVCFRPGVAPQSLRPARAGASPCPPGPAPPLRH